MTIDCDDILGHSPFDYFIYLATSVCYSVHRILQLMKNREKNAENLFEKIERDGGGNMYTCRAIEPIFNGLNLIVVLFCLVGFSFVN